jgi:hypothetical protein
MEDDGIFYGHLIHFTVFCYILWTFGVIHGNLVYFFRFGILYQEKSGNPDREVGDRPENRRSCFAAAEEHLNAAVKRVARFFLI